jgi:hypothetical protein
MLDLAAMDDLDLLPGFEEESQTSDDETTGTV